MHKHDDGWSAPQRQSLREWKYSTRQGFYAHIKIRNQSSKSIAISTQRRCILDCTIILDSCIISYMFSPFFMSLALKNVDIVVPKQFSSFLCRWTLLFSYHCNAEVFIRLAECLSRFLSFCFFLTSLGWWLQNCFHYLLIQKQLVSLSFIFRWCVPYHSSVWKWQRCLFSNEVCTKTCQVKSWWSTIY